MMARSPNTRLQRTRSAPRRSPLSRKPLGATRQLFALLVLCLAVAASCSRGRDSTSVAVAKIRNSDISWDGTYFGLVPRITGASSAEVLRLGKAAVPDLVTALGDPDKFAAAHVLLTQMDTGGTGQKISASAWNGLRVDLLADGSVRLHPEQREELKLRWKSKAGGA